MSTRQPVATTTPAAPPGTADRALGRPVVVGLDGSEQALRALDWAADHADGHRWPLRLVHVQASGWRASDVDATSVFAAATARLATHAHGAMPVSTVVRAGRVTEALLEASADASMLVVGREGDARLAGLVFGSTSGACVARARVPVVVVPDTWRPDARTSRIVVGVGAEDTSRSAVQYAFEMAAERVAPLVAVHAWSLPTRPPDGVSIYDYTGRLETQARHDLDAVLRPWRLAFPTVDVTPIAEFGDAAMALRVHSVNADLVVIGGRRPGTVTGLVLGSEVGMVLRRVLRPVAVVYEPGAEGP